MSQGWSSLRHDARLQKHWRSRRGYRRRARDMTYEYGARAFGPVSGSTWRTAPARIRAATQDATATAQQTLDARAAVACKEGEIYRFNWQLGVVCKVGRSSVPDLRTDRGRIDPQDYKQTPQPLQSGPIWAIDSFSDHMLHLHLFVKRSMVYLCPCASILWNKTRFRQSSSVSPATAASQWVRVSGSAYWLHSRSTQDRS